jgi:limonene-1,2-epoxide hydrolase
MEPFMTTNTDLVAEFISSWREKNVEKMLDYFAEDAVYINIPIDPPNIGKAAIRSVIETFMGMAEALEFIVHHQAETAAGLVLNERTDRFLIKGKWIALPVMGIFELENGKIKAWRDYFDVNQFTRQMQA